MGDMLFINNDIFEYNFFVRKDLKVKVLEIFQNNIILFVLGKTQTFMGFFSNEVILTVS